MFAAWYSPLTLFEELNKPKKADRFWNQQNRSFFVCLESCMNAKVYQDLFTGIITDEYTKLNSELESYMDNNITKFIMGELDLDKDWDNFVSTYLNMGGEQVRTSLLNAYNEANGTSYTFR